MRERDMREWRSLIRERADREWRELSPEVVEELACHLAELHATALARGASQAEARARALDALNAASFLEVSRRPRARHMATGYVHDVRLALRQLNAAPLVSAVAILSLALGIGANTALFSIVNSLLLRPLPVHEPEQLVTSLGSAIHRSIALSGRGARPRYACRCCRSASCHCRNRCCPTSISGVADRSVNRLERVTGVTSFSAQPRAVFLSRREDPAASSPVHSSKSPG